MTKTGADRKAELADVLKLYQDLEKKVKGTPNALRYIQYRMAMLAVDRAKDDPAVDRRGGVERLSARPTAAVGRSCRPPRRWPTCWKPRAMQAGARQAYEELAANPDVPPEVQLNANLQVARLLSRDNKNADAEQKLKSVAGRA